MTAGLLAGFTYEYCKAKPQDINIGPYDIQQSKQSIIAVRGAHGTHSINNKNSSSNHLHYLVSRETKQLQ